MNETRHNKPKYDHTKIGTPCPGCGFHFVGTGRLCTTCAIKAWAVAYQMLENAGIDNMTECIHCHGWQPKNGVCSVCEVVF